MTDIDDDALLTPAPGLASDADSDAFDDTPDDGGFGDAQGMRAAEDAYGQFAPVEDDRSELGAIEAEHEFLLTHSWQC